MDNDFIHGRPYISSKILPESQTFSKFSVVIADDCPAVAEFIKGLKAYPVLKCEIHTSCVSVMKSTAVKTRENNLAGGHGD